jgi:hypothetical protein
MRTRAIGEDSLTRSIEVQSQSAGNRQALLPLEASGPPPALRCNRPSAVFVAHLIATALGTPQTRSRRRAEHGDAQAAYARVMGRQAGQRAKDDPLAMSLDA